MLKYFAMKCYRKKSVQNEQVLPTTPLYSPYEQGNAPNNFASAIVVRPVNIC